MEIAEAIETLNRITAQNIEAVAEEGRRQMRHLARIEKSMKCKEAQARIEEALEEIRRLHDRLASLRRYCAP
jgi:DNA-directed RNA polymerase subunit F